VNYIDFVINAIKNMKTVGTVFPCSPQAARKMTKPVDFAHATYLVELGGGNGAITKEILHQMRPETRLMVFELNPEFAESLRKLNDERMLVINDSAEHLEKYLKQEGIEQVDAVISTLPLVMFDEKTRNGIMDAVMRVVKPSGVFIQIQLSLLTKKEMEERFEENLRIDFTPFNIPPAFFYIITKDAEEVVELPKV
jgi:phospholipid N-methyltransferase